MAQPFMRAPEDWSVEEFFSGTIEEIADGAIRIRSTSIDGEEGIAWLPLDRLRESERKWVMLGAPIRITIVVDRNSSPRKRETQIRVLRPVQWQVTATPQAREQMADFFVREMQALLTGE